MGLTAERSLAVEPIAMAACRYSDFVVVLYGSEILLGFNLVSHLLKLNKVDFPQLAFARTKHSAQCSPHSLKHSWYLLFDKVVAVNAA